MLHSMQSVVYAISHAFLLVDEGQACLHRWPSCKSGNATLGVVCDTLGTGLSHKQGGESEDGAMKQQHHLWPCQINGRLSSQCVADNSAERLWQDKAEAKVAAMEARGKAQCQACISSTLSSVSTVAGCALTMAGPAPTVADFLAECLWQDKAEAKVAAMEARAEEQRQARARADAGWRQQQRERELRRAEEDRAHEKEVGPG